MKGIILKRVSSSSSFFSGCLDAPFLPDAVFALKKLYIIKETLET